MERANEIIRKYKRTARIWIISLFVLVICLSGLARVLFDFYVQLIVLYIGVIFIALYLPRVLYRKVFGPRVLEENDPEVGYHAFLHSGDFATAALCAFAAEKYREAVSTCVAGLKGQKWNAKPIFRYYHFTTLARIYFQFEDYDKLRQVITHALQYFPDSTYGPRYNEFPFFEYYRHFIQGDFEVCRHICQDHTDLAIYHHAIACVQLGDHCAAKELFQSVIDKFPNHSLAKRAKKYIEADFDLTKMPQMEELLPEEAFLSDRVKKFKRKRIVLWICVALILVGLVVTFLGY